MISRLNFTSPSVVEREEGVILILGCLEAITFTLPEKLRARPMFAVIRLLLPGDAVTVVGLKKIEKSGVAGSNVNGTTKRSGLPDDALSIQETNRFPLPSAAPLASSENSEVQETFVG